MNKKYDVFISSKSEDYHYAEDVYNFLTSNGFITFFANKELDKIGEAEYADAIDAALDATTHMIVIASSLENVTSKWVKYEWSTFRNDLNSGYREGNLMTILIGIEPKLLPASLRHQQSFKYESFTDGRILGYLHKKSTKIVPQKSTRISSSTPEMTGDDNKSVDVFQSLGLSQKVRGVKKKEKNNKFNTPQQGVDVYISYSRSDSKIAEVLYESLTRLGLQVWFDKHNLSRNGNYMDVIRKAIQTAKYFVPILSQNITKEKNISQMYRYEWKDAIDQAMMRYGTFIIPITEEGLDFYESNVPKEMQRINAIYFSEESSFEGIAEKIVQIINRN